jgi:hypothetical protein
LPERGWDGVGKYGVACSGTCIELVGKGRGDGGGDTALVGVARGMCGVECEGVGGPDDDGDSGSVTQSLSMLVVVTMNCWV